MVLDFKLNVVMHNFVNVENLNLDCKNIHMLLGFFFPSISILHHMLAMSIRPIKLCFSFSWFCAVH
jgi:hypothetical protein